MKNHLIAALLALTLGLSAVAAAEFWERKKFVEWNPGEVARMLGASPWSKDFTANLEGLGGERGGGGGGAGGGGGGGAGGGGGRGRRGGASSSVGVPDASTGLDGGDTSGSEMGGLAALASGGIPLVMRWQSALPVREAIVRRRFGAQAGTSKEAADMLAARQPVYIVGIEGLPAGAVTGEVDELIANADIRVKNVPPVHPLQVRSEARGSTTVIYLLFPKEQAGAHIITLADGEVEVTLKLASGRISRRFKLKDMLYAGKLEL